MWAKSSRSPEDQLPLSPDDSTRQPPKHRGIRRGAPTSDVRDTVRMELLDAHLHLWDPEELTYDWLTGSLAWIFADLELAESRVAGATRESAIFVQADCAEGQELDEVRWVTSLAAQTGVRGIVAGARLDRGRATLDHLEALASYGLVVGVRHLLQDERDGLALSASFQTGARAVAARGWTFDACVKTVRQLQDVEGLASAVPGMKIVLDHVGKPVVGTASAPAKPAADWVRALGELARHPQVYCKLSGLPAEARGDWSPSQMEPFLDAAADAFGSERLMWGSHWPVSTIGPAEPGDPHAPTDGSPTYQYTARTRWADAVSGWARKRDHDVAGIMFRNAATFYGVDPNRSPARPDPDGWLSRFVRRWFSSDKARNPNR